MAVQPQSLDYRVTGQSYSYDERVGYEEFQSIANNARSLIEAVRKRIEAKEERSRRFTLTELAYFSEIDVQKILKKIKEGEFPQGKRGSNKRRYWLPEDLRQIRELSGNSLNRDPKTDPPATIVVQNNKGGSGKTTVHNHLGVYLALKGMRVLLVDMDPQGSTTAVANYQPDTEVDDAMTVMPYIRKEKPDLRYAIRPVKHWPGLDLIPAASGLAEIDVDLPVNAMHDPQYIFYTQLYEGLTTVAQDYDVVLIDSPPSFTFSALNCIFGAVGLVVPVPPEAMVFDSYRKFNEMVARFLKPIGELHGQHKTFNWVRILVTMYTKSAEDMATYVANTGNILRDGQVLALTMKNRFVQTPVLGGKENRTIYDVTKYLGGRDTYRNALASVEAVNNELMHLILKMWPSYQRKM